MTKVKYERGEKMKFSMQFDAQDKYYLNKLLHTCLDVIFFIMGIYIITVFIKHLIIPLFRGG